MAADVVPTRAPSPRTLLTVQTVLWDRSSPMAVILIVRVPDRPSRPKTISMPRVRRKGLCPAQPASEPPGGSLALVPASKSSDALPVVLFLEPDLRPPLPSSKGRPRAREWGCGGAFPVPGARELSALRCRVHRRSRAHKWLEATAGPRRATDIEPGSVGVDRFGFRVTSHAELPA
jgi:hypothetical protein